MDVDLTLVIGATLMCFSLPALVAAGIDGRRPWVGLFALAAGAALILWAAVYVHGAVPRDLTAATAFGRETLPEIARAIPHAFIELTARIVAYFT